MFRKKSKVSFLFLKLLLEFAKEEDSTEDELYGSIKRMDELSPGTLFCYDILVAALEYENFVEYMESFKLIHYHDNEVEA